MTHFITKRQQYLISPTHAASVQASTVLITGIPLKYLSEPALYKMYNHLPGGVKKVWLNRDLGELPEVYDRRAAACNKLESAENALLKMAAKLRNKKTKAEAKKAKKSGVPASEATPSVDGEGRPLTHSSSDDPEAQVTLAERLVPKAKRPSHRLPAGFMPFSLPFIGQKVDTIDWARQQIVETNEILTKGRRVLDSQGTSGQAAGESNHTPISQPKPLHAEAHDEEPPTSAREPTAPQTKAEKKAAKIEAKKLGKSSLDPLAPSYAPLNSAFITFHQQIAAHMAKNTLNHHEPYRMTGRYAEMAPEDVIWGNLGMNAYEQKVRMLVSYAATAGLIILWAFPGE